MTLTVSTLSAQGQRRIQDRIVRWPDRSSQGEMLGAEYWCRATRRLSGVHRGRPVVCAELGPCGSKLALGSVAVMLCVVLYWKRMKDRDRSFGRLAVITFASVAAIGIWMLVDMVLWDWVTYIPPLDAPSDDVEFASVLSTCTRGWRENGVAVQYNGSSMSISSTASVDLNANSRQRLKYDA